jgi:hypothetical protein
MCGLHLAGASKFGAIGAISDRLVSTLRSISKYLVNFGTIICNKHNELQVDRKDYRFVTLMFNSCG